MQAQNSYERLIDSADNHLGGNALKALQFLDSIPKPLETSIEGSIADYYSVKALIHDELNQRAKVYKNYLLALKYAKIEKNYQVAGDSSLELFANIYIVYEDSTAYSYLEQAKKYYELSGYKNGNLEVELIEAYAHFLDGKIDKCNGLLLRKLDIYRNTKDDVYFYMFALYMLTSNYLYLNNLEEANKYYEKFKSLENNSTIDPYNYSSFDANINLSYAELFYKKKQIDSTLFYLSQAGINQKSMSHDALESYFTISSKVYSLSGKIDKSKAYLDSLRFFQEDMFKNLIDVSYHINRSLIKDEVTQKKESENFLGVFGILLICLISIISIAYFIYYKEQRQKLSYLSNQTENLTYLKSNNEKLAVKVQGLEDYISQLKLQVKTIATIDDVVLQREKIKDFYKELHLSSTTLLEESKNHLELVNNFDMEFFKKIKNLHPKLNDSEIIICYYVSVGFKNKEIAVFLNTSVRAIESKRYRITKKMGLNKQGISLVEYLTQTFKKPNA
ncbi:hypothetical protein [Seonamhaeicola sp. S2-3]|uniref:helix-turn-helix transcriptional regulator n=1 Tax=Seonamhaeicola sp. S2-3 TaxID=1936081 RepID=UPI0012FABB9D|nr:hypothetical protein [Seonamhaeicola sp. S2-3]